MLPDKIVEEILEKQKKAFDEIIYCLTEPNVPLNQVTKRLHSVKTRVNCLLKALVDFKQTLQDPISISKVDDFLKENINRYNSTMNEIITNSPINDTSSPGLVTHTGTDPHYTSIPAGLGKPNAKSIMTAPLAKVDSERLVTPSFVTSTATELVSVRELMAVNPSWGIDFIDGESLTTAYSGDLYYVISPFTDDGKIKIVKFINPDIMAKYVQTTFGVHVVQPSILYGKIARVNYSTSVSIG